ncbi:MAG TPA: TauD/TfdA family dioxygenase [Burkholderiales bacterium]|nr:TauD/TfdA family dioxygenase [Burkholderiales bacterium]
MTLQLRPIHPLFAAEASGIDLSSTLDAATVREIVTAMDEHAVLVFHGQSLSPDRQVALAQQLGPLYVGLRQVNRHKGERFANEAVSDISNLDESGRILERENRKIYSQLANQLWHSDGSFQSPAARYSMLYSVVNPPAGGETEFADLRAAYDELPAEFKQKIEGLRAEHSALYSRTLLGYTGYSEEERNILPPVIWPIVRTHPGSGRKTLYIGAHCTHILGMHVGESRLLLAELLEHATQRRFVHRHRWQPGDLVIWDNRCLLHRGLRYDLSQRRELRRVSTKDVDAPVREVREFESAGARP